MNLYVRIMKNVIDYIEENLNEQMTARSLAHRFFVSEFHFSRIFSIMIGMSLKQYVLSRKLSLAVEKLSEPTASVTDVAYELGFQYPEVFSRAFKKKFGLSPQAYRSGCHTLPLTPKAMIVDRDIINFQGGLTLKESYADLDAFALYGVYAEVDGHVIDFEASLRSAGERFFSGDTGMYARKQEHFYTTVRCHGDDSTKYTVFWGAKAQGDLQTEHMAIQQIPAGCYARFRYHGDMIEMQKTFSDDLCRWMITKEIEALDCGIGMLNKYNWRLPHNVSIYVPVKKAK